MDWAMDIADWKGFEQRRRDAAKRGKLLGRGLANYVESSIGAPNEQARITVRPEGRVDVVIGTQPSGQGHETSFAQVVSDLLRVPVESVKIILGDTDVVKVGGGSHSGRSMRHAATVFAKAAPALIERGKQVAAAILGSTPDQIEFSDGRFSARETNRTFDFLELAKEAARHELPDEIKDGIAIVTDNEMHDPVFPNGCAICEVEIDPDTGALRITRYASVDDVGRCINPLIVHGQTHGGIVQGIGQALWRAMLYRARFRPAADRLADGLRPAARRHACRRSRPRSPRCSRPPIRSASRRAAKAAPPARRRSSSAPSWMRCAATACATSRCRRRRIISGERSRAPRTPRTKKRADKRA